MQPTNGVERAIVGVTNYGSYGVELFFILSGFLITGILYDARNEPRYFRNFYMGITSESLLRQPTRRPHGKRRAIATDPQGRGFLGKFRQVPVGSSGIIRSFRENFAPIQAIVAEPQNLDRARRTPSAAAGNDDERPPFFRDQRVDRLLHPIAPFDHRVHRSVADQ